MFLWYILPPTISCVLARLISGQRHESKLSAACEWLLDFPFYPLLSALLLIPTQRIELKYSSSGMLLLRYGKTAILFTIALAAALGIMRGLRRMQLRYSAHERGGRSVLQKAGRLLLHLFAFATLLLLLALFWADSSFENITVDKLLFHLNMPLQGTSSTFVADALTRVILPALAVFAVFEILALFPSKRIHRLHMTGARLLSFDLLPLRLPRALAALLLVVAWSIMLPRAYVLFSVQDFIDSRLASSSLIEERYVDPREVSIAFPEQPRNLIWLCIESAETTNQDTASGGRFPVNYTPEMTELALEHTAFSQSDLLEGAAIAPATGWTISALVAQTSGLPLKLFTYDDTSTDNMGSQFVYFLPGATTLGDILQEHGYRNFFIAGSDFAFGGRRTYFTQHGDYEIWDLHDAQALGLIGDVYTGWGLQDKDLYAAAKTELLRLAQGDQPFNFSLLTVDSHHPGYSCDLCPSVHAESFGNVLSCSSAQLSDFVSWCQQQPFYENTTIVITGDHASMVSGFYPLNGDQGYNKHSGESSRLVYNAFINAPLEPVNEKNRRFTTLDFFPTMLASIGAVIEGDRLGLGTNLFSDTPTLSEEYGYEYLFSELNKKSAFYNKQLLYPD